MNSTINVIYNLILALWVGGIAIFTFLITPVLFQSFSRDMAGEIVGKLFPGYFWFNLGLSILALFVFMTGGALLSRWGHNVSLGLIILAIIMNAYVTFKLHPEIKDVKKEIHSFVETEDSPLRKKFAKLHAISAGLNLLLLADGITLLIISSLSKK